MRKLSADWIYPVSSEPIQNGVVIVDDNGTVQEVLSSCDGIEDVEQYEGIICPGFVNLHCHLELSYLRDAIPKGLGLVGFIKQLQEQRGEAERDADAMIRAEQEMIDNGIVAVGDISNGGSSYGVKQEGRLRYHTFIEVFGIDPEKASDWFSRAKEMKRKADQFGLRASITPHAPYSICPELFQLLADVDNEILSIHNQEAEVENRMFAQGAGELLELMKSFGLDSNHFPVAGLSSLRSVWPYLQAAQRILLVHNTCASEEDIQFVTESGREVFWCLCPNANLFIEGRIPPVDEFIKAGAKITIGTDSLASNDALSVLEELKTIQSFHPHIQLPLLLKWATLNGAQFLGFHDELGAIEKDLRPGLNLLHDVNLENHSLTANSTVSKLI